AGGGGVPPPPSVRAGPGPVPGAVIRAMAAAGLDGLEVDHPDQGPGDRARWRAVAPAPGPGATRPPPPPPPAPPAPSTATPSAPSPPPTPPSTASWPAPSLPRRGAATPAGWTFVCFGHGARGGAVRPGAAHQEQGPLRGGAPGGAAPLARARGGPGPA